MAACDSFLVANLSTPIARWSRQVAIREAHSGTHACARHKFRDTSLAECPTVSVRSVMPKAIVMEHLIPAGVFGPNETTLDIRAYLVPHATGLTLVDTGMSPSGAALDQALAQAGAAWTDVSEVVITHAHPDHTGALGKVRTSAPHVRVFAHPAENLTDTQPLSDGGTVGRLKAFETPGHTPGHLCLLDEDSGAVMVGDCLMVQDGRLVRAFAQFTVDAEQAERSLHHLRRLRPSQMLFSHGPEIDRPWDELDDLLDNPPVT